MSTTVTSRTASTTTTATSMTSGSVERGAVAVLTRAPSVPRLTSAAADFTDPAAAAAAYLAAWCYQPLNDPANTNIATVQPWMTALGWAQDRSQGVTEQMWTQTVTAGLTSVCGPVRASVSAEAPSSAGTRWVVILARRAYVNRAGKIVGQQNLAETRRVLQGADRRWLVDVAVTAG